MRPKCQISARWVARALSSLYELLPGREGAWRFFALQGAPTNTGYRLFSGSSPMRAQLVRDADRDIQKTHPTLGPEDRKVLSTVWASFPEKPHDYTRSQRK